MLKMPFKEFRAWTRYEYINIDFAGISTFATAVVRMFRLRWSGRYIGDAEIDICTVQAHLPFDHFDNIKHFDVACLWCWHLANEFLSGKSSRWKYMNIETQAFCWQITCNQLKLRRKTFWKKTPVIQLWSIFSYGINSFYIALIIHVAANVNTF